MKSRVSANASGKLAGLFAIAVSATSFTHLAHAQVQRSFLNLGFEQPTLTAAAPAVGCYVQIPEASVLGWTSNHPSATGTGSCTAPLPATGALIELWRTNFGGVPAREGVNFAELNAQQASRLFQNICVTNGEQVRWQLSHRGRSGPGADVMSFNIDSSSNQIMRGSTNPSGTGSVPAGSCGTGSIGGATCDAPTTTSTWADYTGTFTWNGTTGVHNFGFEAISAQGGISSGNFLDRIQVFLTPYVELLPSINSGRESSGAVNTPALAVTGNVATAFTVSLQIDPSSTAVLGTDFTTPGGGSTFSVTIPAGNYDGGASSRFNVGINLIDNAVIENNRTIVLAVQPQPANYTVANSQTCGGTATQTLTYTILDDDVDLRTTKSASTAAPLPGVPFTYSVVYANNTARTTVGATTAHDVTAAISDAVPTGITFTSWTCTASGGASCPGGAVNGSTSGSGALSGNAFLPAGNAAAGGSISYTINAVAGGAPNCAAIRNTSTITTPSPFAEGSSVRSGFVSPAPGGAANNSAVFDVDPVCGSTLTLSKVTLGAAAGPFGFALSNTTQTSGSATTAAAGTPVQVDGDPAAGVQSFTIPASGIGAPVTIQESSGPAGWGLQAAACTLGGAPVGSLAGSTLTIPGASVAENSNYVCTFTNARPRIRLQKALPDGRVLSGDQFQLTIAGPRGGAAASATVTTTGSGNTATGVADFNPADSGGAYTLSEAAAGSTILGLYNPSISCSNATAGSTTPLPSGQGSSFALTPAAGDDITCTISNPKRASTTVQITKVSNGGVGSFAFSGNNGFANQNITTVTPGTGVAAAVQTLTAGLTATTISEAAPPAGFALSSIACTGLGTGGSATPTITGNGSSGGSVLLDAAATAPGSNIRCTFTNTRRTLTLAKTWVNAKLNDAVTVSTTGLANNASLAAVANTANETDSGSAVAVFAGETATIAEVFSTGTATDYTATLSCTGAADTNPNDGLSIAASDTAIVCTQTNTRKTQSFALAKTWVNGSNGHTATATSSGGSASASFTATAPANATGTAVTLRAGDQITLPVETFGGGASAAMYTTTVACSGGTTLAAAAPPQTITISSNTAATTCTYTNTRRRADLSISKTDGATTYTPGAPISYTIVVRNAGPEAANGATVTDLLPASITNANWSVVYAGGASGPASGSGNIAASLNLPANASATFTLTGTVAANTSGDLVNTATIAAPSDLQDPDASNNSATDTDTRSGQADIQVVKTGTTSAGYGAAISYSVVIRNAGPSDANGTTYSDTVPAGISNVAAICGPVTGGAVCSAPTVAGNAVSGTIATLPSGGSVTITITGNAPTSGTSVTNNATAQPPSGTIDPTPNNNTGTATTNLLQPQLTVTKTATPNPFTVGQPASYTITVTNNGAGPTAGNITLSDTLPTGITLVSASGANWSCSGSPALSCVFSGTLAATASTTLTLNVAVAANASNGNNTATASGGGDAGCPAATRCSGAVSVPVNASADIAVSKTVDNATPNVGETVTFTVTATNQGPSNATGVAITDALPGGLVFVSATPSQGSYDNTTGLWTIGALANGVDATLTITATVIQTGAITNTATKSAGDQFDPNSGNNAGSALLNAQPSADLQVNKTANTSTPNLGAQVSFTITVHNAGPNAASGVVVDDLLPTGLSFVSSTASVGSYDGVTGVWTLGALANGADATLTVVATVAAAGDLTNTASIAASDQHDPNTANDSSGVTINGQSADIQVLKTVDQANPTRGQTVSFTITATNQGPSAATGVRIVDTLPTGLSFVSATPSQGSYDEATGVWTLGNLAASGGGAVATLTIVATVDTDTSVTNTASLDALDQTDPNPANNQGTATVTPVASADISVTKTGPASAGYGAAISYSIVIRNAGPSDANGTTYNDTVPTGISNVTAACGPVTGGALCSAPTVAGNAVSGTIATLPSGGSVTITISGNAPTSGTSVTNNATAQPPSGTTDPTPNNNTGAATTTLLQPQLTVTKTATPNPFTVGQPASYTITVTNNGAGPTAGNITLSDTLPTGITLVSASGANWNCSGSPALSCVFSGTLAATASTTLTLNVAVAANATNGNNTATASGGGDAGCPAATRCSGTVSVPVNASADVSVVKTGPATATPGATVSYQLVVSNAGPSTATSVSVSDPTPAGLTLVSADAPCASGFPCTLGSLAAGASATINVTYTIPSGQRGTIANTATVSSPTADPDPSDNTSTVTTTLAATADLSIVKTATPSPVTAGQTLTYTLVVTNAGPSDANGATVSDPLPAGLSNATASCAASGGAVCGSFDNTVAGTITSLPRGGSATITITAKAPNDATSLTNTARVTPPAGVTDPSAGNNQSSVNTTVSPSANVSLVKSGPATITSGSPISYTLLIANAGPSVANGASYSDTVPAGITNVSASCGTPTGGAVCANPNVTGNTVSGTVPTLPANGSVTITITGTAPIGAQTLTNSASVTPPAGTTDPDPADNTDSASTDVSSAADLSMQKTVDNAAPNVGENVTFTVTATNDGPNDATNVAITDGLPVGLAFVSATPSQGTYDNTSGLWTVGTLVNGANATVTITARVTQAGAIVNTATVSASDQFDPDTSNNADSEALNGGLLADIQVNKTADTLTPNLGSNVSFTITVRNAGPSPATGVNVTDLLPAGLAFVSATPSLGTYDDTSGLWTVGDVAANAQETLTIVATVTQAGAITNTATGASNEPDPNSANNQSGVTPNGQAADLQVLKTVDNANPLLGQNVTFTVTLTNLGPNAATHVTANDALPAGLTFVSANPSQGSYDNATGAWTVGDLAATGAGAVATLQITATVAQTGAITNVATSAGGDQTDPTPSNDEGRATVTVPASVDVSISKSGPATIEAAGTITYVLVVSNAGPDAANGATYSDAVPAAITNVQASCGTPTGGAVCANPTITGNTVSGTVPTLPANGSVTITITGTAPNNATTLTNTASVTPPVGSDDPDPSGNTSPPVETEVTPLANLSITKSGPATVTAGGTVAYTIVVNNAGPSDANGTTVSDPLPAGLTNATASCIASGGAVCGAFDNTVAGTITTLPSGGSATITITATAPNEPATLSNVASVTPPAGTTDPTPGDNTTPPVQTQVVGSANLTMTKTGPASATPGTTVSYQLVVSNAGPSTATLVSLSDPTPAGLTLVSADAPCASGFPCNLGDIAAGASATINVTYTIPSGQSGTIANTATVSSPITDPDPSDNSSTVTTALSGSADVSVTKTGPATVNAAGTITYTIVVSNAGPSDANGTTVSDPLPSGLSNATASCAGSGGAVCGSFDNTVAGIITTLPNGGSATITITATAPNDATTLSNTATANPPAGTTDPTPGNNTTPPVQTQVTPVANVSLVKNGPATITSGSPISYTLLIANAGPSVASGASYSDAVPAGITNVSASCGTPIGGAVCADPNVAGNTVSGTVPTLPANGSVTITINGTAPIGAQTLTNTASVTPPAGTTDPTPNDNTGTATTNVGSAADIAVTKTVDNAAPNVGETVTFTVSVTNDGPNDATGVEITDGLPLGLTFVSATPSQGTYDNTSGLWTVGALANAADANLTIVATVTQAGAITNTATRTGGDQPDPDASNNAGSASLNSGTLADIQVAKSVDDTTPNVGADVTFTITVTNRGPSPATNVEVDDALPPGLSYVSSIASHGSYDDSSGRWTEGNLDAGASETLQIVATVMQPGEITNIATGTATETDPNLNNNQAGVTINGQSADIQVVKTVDVAAPPVNGQVTYTVTVTNNGPSAATNVTAIDALPAGLSYVSSTATQGSYADAGGLWTIGDLAASGAGATATLTIVATVNADQAGTTITNVASSAGGDQTDPTPGNNQSQVPIVPLGQADVSVVKTGPASVTPGTQVTYTLQVSNAGPSTAGQVSLADPTPAGLSFVSADAPCAAGFPCNLGDLAAGASITVTATYSVPSDYAGADPLVNSASVSSPTADPDTSDNSSTVTAPLSRSANLSISKTGPAAVAAGGAVSYTLVVRNAGPSDANGATVSDSLPAGLTNATATCANETGGAVCGAFDNTVAGTITTLPSGGSATITITATAPTQPATLTNTATVTPPTGTTDPTPSDNTSPPVVTEVGAPTADLSITKSGPSVIAPGNTLVYTIVVTNAGPNTAASVQVADTTPPGLTFVGNAGACTSAYPCALGDLASGASATITSTYEVPLDYAGANPIVNTATASSPTSDPNANNDSATAQTPVDASGQVADMMATGAATQTVSVNTPVEVVTSCTNNGPLPAIGATCTVTEPNGPDSTGPGPLATTCTPAPPVASLAVGATITCTTQFTPNQPGTWTLQTTAASQTPDAVPANNVAPSVVIAQAPDTADLRISKQGPATAAAGGTIVYTLSVTNQGPAAASAVTVTDPTPAGLSFVRADAPCASGFPCTLGTLASGQTTTFTATYAIDAGRQGTIVNTATASSSTPDPDPANDSSSSTTTVSGNPPIEQVPVPVDARWMLALMSLLLMLVAGAQLRRRRD